MKNTWLKLKEIPSSTLGRIIALIIACINQVVAVIGASSFASANWYQILSVVATVVCALWTAWQNNDLTLFSKITTRLLDALEDGDIDVQDVEDLLEKNEAKLK